MELLSAEISSLGQLFAGYFFSATWVVRWETIMIKSFLLSAKQRIIEDKRSTHIDLVCKIFKMEL